MQNREIFPKELSQKIQQNLDLLNLSDNFQVSNRKVEEVYLDGKLVSPNEADQNEPFRSLIELVYNEDYFLSQDLTALQVAFIVNNLLFGNSFGSPNLKFTSDSFMLEEARKKHPIIIPFSDRVMPFDYYSVLYLQFRENDEETKFPLFYFADGPKKKRKDGSGLFDGSVVATKMKFESEINQIGISPEMWKSLRKILQKLIFLGLPALQTLNTEAKINFPNPFDSSGWPKVTLDFFESDPAAAELRQSLIEIITLLRHKVENNNTQPEINVLINKKVKEIKTSVEKRGIDLTNYESPSQIDRFRPYEFVLNILVALQNNFSLFENNKSFQETAQELTPLKNSDLPQPEFKKYPVFSREEFTLEQVRSLALYEFSRTLTENLCITQQEVISIQMQYNLI